jgi:hypothetical protein
MKNPQLDNKTQDESLVTYHIPAISTLQNNIYDAQNLCATCFGHESGRDGAVSRQGTAAAQRRQDVDGKTLARASITSFGDIQKTVPHRRIGLPVLSDDARRCRQKKGIST